MKLSIVMPARNEEGCVATTLSRLTATLNAAAVPYEILLVNDGSTDATASIVSALSASQPRIRLIANTGQPGFGMAIRCGIDEVTGDAVAVVMADGSDAPEDVVGYYRKLQEGYECAFGSRFISGSRIIDYPKHKLLLNRVVNNFIRAIFRFGYNDTTNAFKMYRTYVVEAMQPLISPHFNLTVEMPLKAIIRGYSYAIVPISWTNRRTGASKLKLKEMGSRYLFIILYLWLEKTLSRGDYHRRTTVRATDSVTHHPVPDV